MTAPESLIQTFKSDTYGEVQYKDKNAQTPSQKPRERDIVLVCIIGKPKSVPLRLEELHKSDVKSLTKEIIDDMIESDNRKEGQEKHTYATL